MNIFKNVLGVLPGWPWLRREKSNSPKSQQHHLILANESLRALLEDEQIPDSIRLEMRGEFDAIEALSRKLTEEEIHIAVFGRVSVGKSSVLNALLGEKRFSTSPLHGETKTSEKLPWHSVHARGVFLIDTPGIDELAGEEREALAHAVSKQADLILFVCDSDLTRVEQQALADLAGRQRPILLLLNKADQLSDPDRELLLARLSERSQPFHALRGVFAVSADPRPEIVIQMDSEGKEIRQPRQRPADIAALQRRLWEILEKEGKTLAALNAAMFASELDSRVAERMVQVRQELAERVVSSYSIGKGLLVAVNPVPVADLLAAAGTDIALVIHLGEIYGFQLSRREASRLLLTIAGQLAALMGAYWGVNLVSAALKGVSAGLSTALTAGTQGALAYYATYLVGRAAEAYFLAGRSWGEEGAKYTIRSIIDSLDRDSILSGARQDILSRLKQA